MDLNQGHHPKPSLWLRKPVGRCDLGGEDSIDRASEPPTLDGSPGKKACTMGVSRLLNVVPYQVGKTSGLPW